MVSVVATYSVCETCYLAVAGYDAHELGVPEVEYDRALSLLSDRPMGTLVNSHEGDACFSYAECEGCGDTLGGNRYDMTELSS